MNRVFLNESTSNLGHLASGGKKAFKAFVQITTLEKEIGGILIAVFPFSLPLFLICLGHRSRRFFFRPINSTRHKNGTFGEFLHHTK